MNSIYWPSVKEKLGKYKFLILLYLCACLVAAGYYGYKKMSATGQVSQEYLVAVEEYDAALAEYDASIADVEAAIKQQTDAVRTKQDYVDNAVYMRLNPDEVYVGSLQFTITVAEGVNIGSVGNALLSYCRDGGLIEDAEKICDSPDIKYWQEVITLQLNANTNFNVAIMAVDEATAKEANDIIRKCISWYLPAVKDDFGEFKLELMNESIFTKSEVAVVNNQNSHRNDLRSNISTKADLETKLVNTKANKASFIEKNQPVSVSISPKAAFVKNFVIIIILGVGSLVALFWFIFTFDKIVRGIADLEQLGLSVLGHCQKKKGFTPEADRIAMDVALIAGKNGSSSVYIANIGNEAECIEAVSGLSEAVAKKDLTVLSGFDPIDKADVLTDMLVAGQCVLVVRCGLTKTARVKEFCDVCKKYGIAVMGTVAVM